MLPLSLYIHIPWCVRKCPYCDFNSHQAKSSLPEDLYVAALKDELSRHLSLIQQRPIKSIFFGGGTPSLFSPHAIGKILDEVAGKITLDPKIEITLEANPGTIDQANFSGFRTAGINRLSLGIQSLQNDKLKTLGRIHDRDHAISGINIAKQAGFENFNLDLMFGLPEQTLDDALSDLQDALSFEPTHFSWYQLTIEPNTAFYKKPPVLPHEDKIWEMQLAGQEKLQSAGYKQYEVSAYSKPDKQCLHNLNYWEFGDYLGLGAGAHSKMTDHESGKILRFSQVRHPKDYLDVNKRRIFQPHHVSEKDLIFEFMLNSLRLTDGVPVDWFAERTNIELKSIEQITSTAKARGLLIDDDKQLCATELGKRFLNDLIGMFL